MLINRSVNIDRDLGGEICLFWILSMYLQEDIEGI